MAYLHKDHLGSIETVTTPVLSGQENLGYDAWGNRRGAPSVNTTRGFTGHEQLDSVGLVHMDGRVYDPVLGRFLSPDPTVQAPTNSQSYNRYTYVFNNPLSFTDPTGYTAESVAQEQRDQEEEERKKRTVIAKNESSRAKRGQAKLVEK